MPETIVVHGVTELRAALARLAAEAPQQVAFTNKKAANVVAQEARREAPHGPHEGGGTVVPIAASITVVATPLLASVIAGGPKTPHAAGAEWGGRIPRRGMRGLSRRARRAAQAAGARFTRLHRHSYLVPALNKKAEEVVAVYDQMVGDLIARFER